jgi:transcription antitermination factor NusG
MCSEQAIGGVLASQATKSRRSAHGAGRSLSLFPESLFEETIYQPSLRCWWVLYTKVHQEKALAQKLVGYQVPYYLPLVEKAWVWRGRRFTSPVPLFAGYMFLFGTEEERVTTLATNRVSRVLPVHDPDRLAQDLCQLRQLIASGAPLTVEQRLAPGQRVRVRSGVFAGIEGRVLKRRGATRLLVGIDFLQQGASVEIERCLLEPII